VQTLGMRENSDGHSTVALMVAFVAGWAIPNTQARVVQATSVQVDTFQTMTGAKQLSSEAVRGLFLHLQLILTELRGSHAFCDCLVAVACPFVVHLMWVEQPDAWQPVFLRDDLAPPKAGAFFCATAVAFV
jgi:hypothetical protein